MSEDIQSLGMPYFEFLEVVFQEKLWKTFYTIYLGYASLIDESIEKPDISR